MGVRKCRTLTPTTALLVIVGAVLWLPISFGVATAIHAILIAEATSLPAWMQLLHPLATLIAKQAAGAAGLSGRVAAGQTAPVRAGDFPVLSLSHEPSRHAEDRIRYRQTEYAAAKAADAMGRAAVRVGLDDMWRVVLAGLGKVATQALVAAPQRPDHRERRVGAPTTHGPDLSQLCRALRPRRPAGQQANRGKLRALFARWATQFFRRLLRSQGAAADRGASHRRIAGRVAALASRMADFLDRDFKCRFYRRRAAIATKNGRTHARSKRKLAEDRHG